MTFPILVVSGNYAFDYLFSIFFWLSLVFFALSLPIKLMSRS